MPLPQRIIDTTPADLERLIADKAREGPHLDFKRSLPSNWNDSAKQEFLADVTAFANAGGGDIIYGIDEDGNAQASKLAPQKLDAADEEVRRLQDFLASLVEPPVPGVQPLVLPADVGDGSAGHIVIVRVPQSWVGPHRLRMKASQNFYVREGGRKRQLDIPEIRGLFLRSDSQVQRVRDFRTERLAKVMTGETPYKLADGPVLTLHLVPLQAAMARVNVDPVQYLGLRRRIPVVAASSGAIDSLVNLDGAAGTRNLLDRGTNGYTLLFRSGFIETTWVLGSQSAADRSVLPGGAFEDYLAQFVERAREEMAHWGLSGQAIALLSIAAADVVTLAVQREYAGAERGKFDRKVLAIPDVELAGEAPVRDELKPLFDLVWQSAGFHGSPHYDGDGHWVGTQR